MSHRFCRLAVALGIAVLAVALAAGPAHASNMGFKLERTLTYQPNFFNFYYESFPFFRSFPDWDNDTRMTSADVLEDLFLHSHNPPPADLTTLGSMTLIGFDNETGGEYPTDNAFYWEQVLSLDGTTLSYFSNFTDSPTTPNGHFYVDEVNTPGWRGYIMQVGGDPVNPTQVITHNTVIVGSHNPAITQATLPIVAGYFNFNEISEPYHTTRLDFRDVACAIWVASLTGATDCNFDNPSDASFSPTVITFDNTPGSPTANSYVGCQLFSLGPGSGTQIVCNTATGNPPAIVPGEGYDVQMGGDGTVPGKLPFPHY